MIQVWVLGDSDYFYRPLLIFLLWKDGSEDLFWVSLCSFWLAVFSFCPSHNAKMIHKLYNFRFWAPKRILSWSMQRWLNEYILTA